MSTLYKKNVSGAGGFFFLLLLLLAAVGLSAGVAAIFMLLLGVVLGGTSIGGPAFTTSWAILWVVAILGSAWNGSSTAKSDD